MTPKKTRSSPDKPATRARRPGWTEEDQAIFDASFKRNEEALRRLAKL